MRYFAALLAILVVIALPACAPKDAPAQAGTASPAVVVSPAAPAALSESDLEFTLNGAAYKLKTDIKPLLDALGSGYELTAAVSCLYVGEDKTYAYPDVSISTFPQGDSDIIDEIDLLTDKYATSRGVRVGDTLERVKAAYGENCSDDGYIVTYTLNGDPKDLASPQVYFEITDGKVTTIGLYSASNIQ
jgi:hypothetical protein